MLKKSGIEQRTPGFSSLEWLGSDISEFFFGGGGEDNLLLAPEFGYSLLPLGSYSS